MEKYASNTKELNQDLLGVFIIKMQMNEKDKINEGYFNIINAFGPNETTYDWQINISDHLLKPNLKIDIIKGKLNPG